MMRIVPLFALGLALGACRPDDQQEALMPGTEAEPVAQAPAAEDLPDDVRRAVNLARQLDENPSLDAETMLQTEALSRQEFNELMYEIASDPQKTRQYLQARQPSAGARTTELPSRDRFQ